MHSLKPFLKKYYLFCLFSSLDFTRAIHLVYVLSIGHNNSFTGVLQTILFLSTFLFEVPFGYLADRYKKKYVLFAGSMFFVFSGLIYLTTSNKFIIPFVYIFQGIGFSLYSGASFSLLYNTLNIRENVTITKYLAISRKISFYGLGFAIIVGGYLALVNWKIVFFLFTLSNLIAGIVVISINEKNKRLSPVKNSFKLDIKLLFSDKKIFILVFGFAFLEAFHTPFFIFFQNFLKAEEFSTLFISLVIASAIFLSSLILLFEKYVRHFNIFKKYYFTLCILIASVFFFNLTNSIFIKIVFFFMINCIPSLFFVFSDNYLNIKIPNEVRATFMSMVSLINSIVISITYLTIGLLFDKLSHNLAISSLILLLAPSFILTYIYKKML